MTGNNYGVKIALCSCNNEYQDKIYGKGMRLHNNCSLNKDQMKGIRCTVCGKVKAKVGK